MPTDKKKPGRKPRVTDDDLLGVFRETADPVLSTAEVADALPIKRRGTLNRLRDLEDDGTLDSKQIGGRNTVWWLSGSATGDEGRRETATDTPRSDPGEESGEDVDSIDARSRPESDGPLADAVREYLDANNIPPKTAHGRGAVIDTFRYLREHGTSKTGAIQDAVYPEYKDSWSTPRTMWNAVDRHLEAVPGIEKGGYGKWTYAGDDAVRETLRGKS
jgi:hypothetical protein